jgi:DNA-directed RNA polymerase subunit RPC12/RpoP
MSNEDRQKFLSQLDADERQNKGFDMFQRFTTYVYDDKRFRSSWELAYYVFSVENGLPTVTFDSSFIEKNRTEIEKCVSYVYAKYGNHFFEDCKVKASHSKGKRVIVPITSLDEIYSVSRKKHPKFSYNCTECGALVITGRKILEHFKDLKCKKCRALSKALEPS